MNYEDYKRIMGLKTVPVESKLEILREIQRIQRENGRSVAGFTKMPKKQLFAIWKRIRT